MKPKFYVNKTKGLFYHSSLTKGVFILLWVFAIPTMAGPKADSLPDSIPVEAQGNFHIQGVAMDKERRYFYLSYTTQLVKLDLKGRVVGSVSGLLGHLGCIAYNPQDGKVYGSLEYKNDEIGRDISDKSAGHRESATQFYVAVFDVDKITRTGMDGLRDGVMRTVCLPTVKKLYEGTATVNGTTHKHVYGCSGIDGISFGPRFGKKGGKPFLTVALGVYGDIQRTDNDYQVLLQYPWPSVMRHARPLDLNRMHTEGPAKPAATYFAYTGNTNYGVQNLEYDPESDQWFMAVYKGTKQQFPNYQLFAIDNTVKPSRKYLTGHGGERGLVVQLSKTGLYDAASGVYGWRFRYGSMGMQAMGDGYFYFLHPDRNSKGGHGGWLELYRYRPETLKPFVRVKP
ncbi:MULTISPECIES: hypothetical protein [Prevotella]|nr:MULTISPECIES: hypothetical protein [Prevotella]